MQVVGPPRWSSGSGKNSSVPVSAIARSLANLVWWFVRSAAPYAAMSSLRHSSGSGAGAKWVEDLESDTIARLNRVTRGQTETSERLLLALSQRSAEASLRRSSVEDAPDDGYLLKEELRSVREEVMPSLSPPPPPELRAW